ncbi:MAG: der [Phycisphaerales bacterium]|nr:der [Phycisphaerales bacterium]
MTRLPVVAIVGRPNVGKSSLLNALSGKTISIVQDMPGVTRDRITTPIKIGEKYVELVDTGGYGFVDADDLTDHIREQVEQAMVRADLVLFLVDTQAGPTPADQGIAKLLREAEIKTILVANKTDGEKADAGLADFARLGLGTPLGISATNKRNLDELFAQIEANVDLADAPTDIPAPTLMVAIVGKRNAGKSTLVNSIAEIYEGVGDRVIVSEVPGTTRDSIDVRFEKDGKALTVIDTAGVRKKRLMVTDDLQFYSFHRAERSIRRADVTMMLIDATERISDPDRKLAGYIADQHKPVLLVINKWDLARELLVDQAKSTGHRVDDTTLMEQYKAYLDKELRHLDYAPVVFVTAKEGKNVQAAIDVCQHLNNQANVRVSTSKLNAAVREIMTERGPSTKYGKKIRVYYVTQTNVAPPQIVMFVNNPEFLTPTYERYMINRLREMLPFPEVPIRLFTKARTREDYAATNGPAGPKAKGGKAGTRGGSKPSATPKNIPGRPRVAAAEEEATYDQGLGERRTDRRPKVSAGTRNPNRAAVAKGRRAKTAGVKKVKVRRKREGA